ACERKLTQARLEYLEVDVALTIQARTAARAIQVDAEARSGAVGLPHQLPDRRLQILTRGLGVPHRERQAYARTHLVGNQQPAPHRIHALNGSNQHLRSLRGALAGTL